MIRTPKAREVLTKPELDLYLNSLARAVKQIPHGRLKQKVVRARTLRDKYRGLAARQRREARGKAQPRGSRAAQTNERTKLKQQIFTEVLERYQAALKAAPKPASKKSKPAPGRKRKVKAQKKKARKKAAPRKKAKAAAKKKRTARKKSPWKSPKKKARRKKRASTGRVGKTAQSLAARQKAKRFKHSSTKRGRLHVAARGRRNQAKRDSRSR